tara:strand:- start:2340 stop:3530 length:1191 start_codon:yes stop_codon:yes gene_type:complete
MIKNAKERVTAGHISIMRSREFCMFSGVLSLGEITFTEDIPTAQTNGRDVSYNPKFLDTLNQQELTFIILHEAMHRVYQQIHLWQHLFKEDAQLTNMSADYVVNAAIIEAQEGSDTRTKIAVMPEGGLYDTKYQGMTTKQIFNALKKDKENQEGRFAPGQEEGNKALDEHDFDGASELSKQEIDETSQAIDTALRQGELIRGQMGGKENKSVSKLLVPQVDWREQLLEWMTGICRSKDYSSYRRPSKRFIGQDIYMPSVIGQTVESIVFAEDTSASVTDEERQFFRSELVSVCSSVKPKRVDLLYWDTEVANHEVYEEGEYDSILTTTKPAGGGGTTVGCVNEYIRDKNLTPDAVIILTDGGVEEDWGGVWQHPTLWVVTNDYYTSPHGKSIHLKT